ncbi:hypothetical protein D3C81_1569540 [compost metagenome]
MGDADASLQQRHAALIKHIPHQATGLFHTQTRAVDGGDARGILAAMLEDGQAVIKLPGDVLVADDSDDATHVARSPLGAGARLT